MRLIRSADYHRMPWKNGGGTMADIIAAPEGAGLGEFDWRVSTAHVGRDGPFSVFPGIDRIIKILGDGALRLEIAGHQPAILSRADAPYAFAGDAPTGGFLEGGPVDDLNLMVRRGRFGGSMRQEEMTGELLLAPKPGGTILIYLEQGQVSVAEGTGLLTIEAGDTLVIEAPARLQTAGPATLCIMDVWPL